MGNKQEIVKFSHSPNIIDFPYPIAPEQIALRLIYEGDPVSKARPRFGGNGKVYTPAKTRHYEEELRWIMRGELKAQEPDRESRFALRCLFFRSTRQRIDCDNLLKAVSDAANGQVWRDDAQVMEVFGRLYLFENNPRAEILIFRMDDSAPRQKCLTCNKEFITYPSLRGQYCSTECFNKSRRVVVTCKECGKGFEIVQSLANKRAGFCSRACSMSFWGREKRSKGSDLWVCQDCGNPVSRKEYTRCRACGLKHRQEPTSNYWKVRYSKTEIEIAPAPAILLPACTLAPVAEL